MLLPPPWPAAVIVAAGTGRAPQRRRYTALGDSLRFVIRGSWGAVVWVSLRSLKRTYNKNEVSVQFNILTKTYQYLPDECGTASLTSFCGSNSFKAGE